MSDPSTLSVRYVNACAEMLRQATRQRRTGAQALVLTVGLLLVVGRTMLSRVLIATGRSTRDWSAAYRLFAHGRIRSDELWRQVALRWEHLYPDQAPVVMVMDATQLPRTGTKIPGSGFARAPRTPAWNPGIHRAQRWEGVSGLTPPTPMGDSRTIPLWFMPAPSASARPWRNHPPMAEWQAGMEGVQWVRNTIDPAHPCVVVGDGGYSGAPVWNALPENTTLIARCAKNRALFALPDPDEPPHRGRRRLYGRRGPAPQEQGNQQAGSQVCAILVRGKSRHLRIWVTGPWVMHLAPDHPLLLITIAGIDRSVGRSRRTRAKMHFLVNARQNGSGWELPYPLADLAGWVWQRWEVEVMHRELKSGWGLGDQQQWSPVAAAAVTQWVVWAYAVLILTGVTMPPTQVRTTGWHQPRRWTPRDLARALREELWTQAMAEKRAPFPVFDANRAKIPALSVLLEVADAI